MNIKRAIKEAIRVAYSVPSETSTMSLKKDSRLKNTPKLANLIDLINDVSSVPKIVAHALEDVVATIKLEDEKYDEELLFLSEIKRLVYDPQNKATAVDVAMNVNTASKDAPLKVVSAVNGVSL